MNINWSGISNYFKHTVTVVGHDIAVAGKLFNIVEPYAAAVITPVFPEAAVILRAVYGITKSTEDTLSAPGQTKLQHVQDIISTAVIPTLGYGLSAAGKTIDQGSAITASTDLINAVVAENNAQAKVVAIISAAVASGQPPDNTILAEAQKAVTEATNAIFKATAAVQATVKTIAPVTTTKT